MGAVNALLLLPLKSRSGADPLLASFLLLLGGRRAVSEVGNEELRESLREGGFLLLPLKESKAAATTAAT